MTIEELVAKLEEIMSGNEFISYKDEFDHYNTGQVKIDASFNPEQLLALFNGEDKRLK